MTMMNDDDDDGDDDDDDNDDSVSCGDEKTDDINGSLVFNFAMVYLSVFINNKKHKFHEFCCYFLLAIVMTVKDEDGANV